MKEKAINLNTREVRGLHDGSITLLLRVIKPPAPWVSTDEGIDIAVAIGNIKCPYSVGDRLWGRETFVLESDLGDGSEKELKQWADRPIKSINGGCEWGMYHLIPHYRATEPEPNIVSLDTDDDDDRTRWTPSQQMPRWASRITLEVTSVEAGRVQGVTEEEAIRNGVNGGCLNCGHEQPCGCNHPEPNYRDSFIYEWDNENLKCDHFANPWVWKYGVKRV